MDIHRSLTGAWLVSSLLLSAPLHAQGGPAAPVPQTLEEANAQRARLQRRCATTPNGISSSSRMPATTSSWSAAASTRPRSVAPRR